MVIFFLVVSFLASVVGAICGIGGGIIIKPVLDATGVMGVSEISFLSGCTVLSMAVISVMKSLKRKDSSIELKQGTALAVGAAVGGVVGKILFQYAYVIFPDKEQVGAIQAAILFIITIGTLIYTIFEKRIQTHNIKNLVISIAIGFMLGIISSFLGIGGGPINLVVLAFFFSMDTKTAAVNSLYIILFSQASSLINSLVCSNIPKVDLEILIIMVIGGVAGGLFGSKVNRKISNEGVSKLFIALMVVIIFICMYNILKFSTIC